MTKSVARIILGVLLGIGCLVAVAVLGRSFPLAAPRVLLAVMGLGIAILAARAIALSLRRGFTGGRYIRYERQSQPAHFWFYILFYSLLGVIFGCFGACAVFLPRFIFSP